jgi:sialidase-1
MDKKIESYIVHEEILNDHSVDKLRSGEGAVASLKDGSLYMVYTDFAGGEDHDKANLMERRSHDGGITWSEPKILLGTPENALNVMSVSLCELKNKSLAVVYLKKTSNKDCIPHIMLSKDNALSWSKPVAMITRPGYYVGNNDRLIQLSSGRLLLPYNSYGDNPDFGKIEAAVCGCAVSDDSGITWRLSKTEIKIKPENAIMPKLLDGNNLEKLVDVKVGRVQCQEPGVVELPNGKVCLWCRTPGGYAYRAFSEDDGDTWSDFKPITEFSMPCGPQSIVRLPGSKRLIMLYNDRDGVPYGNAQYHWRRPLTIAVSDDNALTWRRHGLLEPERVPSNCYYSICFHRDNVVFTYYEGIMEMHKVCAPRNLSSLKLKIIKKSYFEL